MTHADRPHRPASKVLSPDTIGYNSPHASTAPAVLNSMLPALVEIAREDTPNARLLIVTAGTATAALVGAHVAGPVGALVGAALALTTASVVYGQAAAPTHGVAAGAGSGSAVVHSSPPVW